MTKRKRNLFTNAEWYKFPLKLRQSWWDETDYSKNESSLELKAVLREELKKIRAKA